MTTLSSDQRIRCTDILSQLEPGIIPLEIFEQIARLMRLPTVLLIPIKRVDGQVYVGVVRREANDRWWPGLLHLAGTVLRSTDTMETALQRLIETELQLSGHQPPVFHENLVHQSKRGAELQLIHSVDGCELAPDSPLQWFPINALPTDFLATERSALQVLERHI